MNAKLTAPRSGTIELLGFDGKFFQLRSADAFAPGQPLTVTITLASEHVLDLKSLGSIKRAEAFEVRARALTLRKETRDALLAHFAPG
jgi:hypothetical protein